MKDKTMKILSVLFLLTLAFSGNALATYIASVHGSNQINDDKDSVMDLLNSEGVSQDYGEFTFLAKIDTDGPNKTATDDWGDFILDGLGQSGGWETTLVGVDYITVKGGTSFAIYAVDHLGAGGWTTEELLNNGGNIPICPTYLSGPQHQHPPPPTVAPKSPNRPLSSCWVPDCWDCSGTKRNSGNPKQT